MIEDDDQFKDRQEREMAMERINAIFGHFKAIVDSSDDAIISKDLNGIIMTWNKWAEKLFGYTAEEAIGQPVTFIFPPEALEEEPRILAKIRAGERIDHYETVRKRQDGRLIDISLTVSPIKDCDGKIIGASKIARDITERKQWEAQMKRAHDELKHAHDDLARANRAKDNFLAMLSHELRTPLNPVLLVASDAAADTELPEEVRANFEMILKNVEMEARLIDDLLDLSRVRTGKLKLEKRKLDLHEVLENSLGLVRPQADEKGVALVEEVEANRAAVLGDAVRLQQVFSNVLRNAVKFTPENGTVTVRAEAIDEEYIVTVTDTGIGMTPEELAVAFEAFRQGEHSAGARSFGGLGLGLAISREFLKCHEGTITASSEGRGHGSSFTIRLPLLNGHGVGNTEHFRAEDFERGAHFFRNRKVAGVSK